MTDHEENAVDLAVRSLRRMIFDGELKANQPLRQEELASRLGFSRHPVREALGRLTAEGLVRFRARRGYTVVALGEDEITEIFEMRMVLEEQAGYVATLRRDAEAVAKVALALEEMDWLDLPGNHDIAQWGALNRRFHETLFEASGRHYLCRTISNLWDCIESYIRLSVFDEELYQRSQIEHREIFDAFKHGDAVHVARLCRQHVRHSVFSPGSRAAAIMERAGRAARRRPYVAG